LRLWLKKWSFENGVFKMEFLKMESVWLKLWLS